MNYIEQINLLHRIRRKDSLEPITIALHVVLLDICNSYEWENPFSLKNDRILSDLNVTFKTLAANRNKLQQSGLIKFKTKNGSPECLYEILDSEQCKEFRTSVKIPKVREEVREEVGAEVTAKVREKVKPVYTTGIIKPKPKQKLKQEDAEDKPPLDEKNVSEKKESKPPSLYVECMAIYSTWFEGRYHAGPKIDGQQGNALKSIIAYLTTQVKKKAEPVQLEPPELEAKVKQSWEWILNNWEKLEQFYQAKTKLSEISSNMQNIIVQIKNPKVNGPTKQQQGKTGKVPIWRQPGQVIG